ncbi:MAG: hypothetical protein D3925_11750 [Candidatus Electrothrix sp. AR5]|nr:hypothetical protein [Candidatus Electrothrix sp. AR5]
MPEKPSTSFKKACDPYFPDSSFIKTKKTSVVITAQDHIFSYPMNLIDIFYIANFRYRVFSTRSAGEVRG